MVLTLTRRDYLLGSAALLVSGSRSSAQGKDLVTIENRHGGRLGFFALDIATNRTLAHRADERFTLCSTFKGLLAAQILSRVDTGHERLDRNLKYSETDLLFTSPITKANVALGALPVGTLCKAIVQVSDNTAAVLLLKSVGGPQGLTRFIRSLGDTVTRSDRFEPASNDYSGELDTTSPRAIVGSAKAILLGNVLKPNSRDLLINWMATSTTGNARLRASLPAGWFAADKTGTSAKEETNDYILIRPPRRAPIVAAAYYDAGHLTLDQREAVLREAGSPVAMDWLVFLNTFRPRSEGCTLNAGIARPL